MMASKVRLVAASFAVIGVTAAGAQAQAPTTTTADRLRLDLTVYGNGLALVKDRRRVEFPNGVNKLDVTGVSPRLIADSVQADFGPSTRVLSQILRPANLNPQSLLASHLGKTLKLIRTHPQTGAETVVDATLISIQGGIIARIGEQLVSNPAGRWAFPEIPAHLRGEPVLALAAEAADAGKRELKLRYLTGGVSWRAAYTANWDQDAKTLRLNAWASLKNGTGMDFNNANVKVVAGQVRRVSAPPRPVARGAVMMKAEAAVSDQRALPVRQQLAGYHLYSLPQPVTLKLGEEVQAALLTPMTVTASRELVSDGHPAVFGRVRGGGGRPTHPAIRLSFETPKDDRAQPLPAGVVRLYGQDTDGGAQFLGEDRMGDTPVGATVRLNAGNAFDVTVKREQTNFRRENRNTFEVAYRVVVRNGGTGSDTVKIVETIPGDWQLLDSDQPHTRENNQAVWRIAVPARDAVSFTYRARIRN